MKLMKIDQQKIRSMRQVVQDSRYRGTATDRNTSVGTFGRLFTSDQTSYYTRKNFEKIETKHPQTPHCHLPKF